MIDRNGMNAARSAFDRRMKKMISEKICIACYEPGVLDGKIACEPCIEQERAMKEQEKKMMEATR